jgi:c-di-AMP phosphodiesterase-like protein
MNQNSKLSKISKHLLIAVVSSPVLILIAVLTLLVISFVSKVNFSVSQQWSLIAILSLAQLLIGYLFAKFNLKMSKDNDNNSETEYDPMYDVEFWGWIVDNMSESELEQKLSSFQDYKRHRKELKNIESKLAESNNNNTKLLIEKTRLEKDKQRLTNELDREKRCKQRGYAYNVNNHHDYF